MATPLRLSQIWGRGRVNAVVWEEGPAPGQHRLTVYNSTTGGVAVAILTTRSPTEPAHWLQDPLVDPDDFEVPP